MNKNPNYWDSVPSKDWDTTTEQEKLTELGFYKTFDGDGDSDISIGSIQIDNY